MRIHMRTPAVLVCTVLAAVCTGCVRSVPAVHRDMTVAQACNLLNTTQASYGMNSTQGRKAMITVRAHITSKGEGSAIRWAVTQELAHPPVHNMSQYNADWANDCMIAVGHP